MRLTACCAVVGFFLLSSPGLAAEAVSDCDVNQPQMLALSYQEFDQTPRSGWRLLAEDRQGCETAAADLIAKYRSANRANIRPDRLLDLNWHEGQLRAAIGQTPVAIELFSASRPVPRPGDVAEETLERSLYIDATIAFLRKDKPALYDAWKRYISIPEPEEFRQGAAEFEKRSGTHMSWPPSLRIMKRLVGCFGKNYSEAYGSLACESLSPAVSPLAGG